MNEFDGWAVYYDSIHQGLPGEAEFYVGLAAREMVETLELGCGTGRIAIPMAMCGVSVTGIDLSLNMLSICREKAASVEPLRGRLHLLQADMRAFALDKRFPLIVLPYRGFMHLLTSEDQVACLECVRRHLAPGGRFVLNLWAARPSVIGPFVRPAIPPGYEKVGVHEAGEEVRLHHYHKAEYDEARQWIREWHRIEERDGAGALLHEEALTMTRSWLTPREMEHLAYRCGFEPEACLGDFDAHPFGPESTEMLWVLRAG